MSPTMQDLNHITATFHLAMSKALASENKDDWITHLKAMSNAFTQVCVAVTVEESEKSKALEEHDAVFEKLVESRAKADFHDYLISEIHVLMAAQRWNADPAAHETLVSLLNKVNADMKQSFDFKMIESRLKVEKWRNKRMQQHINELSKQSVMHQMATRFYARELAAVRQLMDLVRNAATIETAIKSKLWDQIEAENRLLRLNTLWLINRINSSDLSDAPFENGDHLHSPPRLVILMREHFNQGLGLEITGGSDQFRPVIVTNKLKRSMADDDQLMINDRILAIDGTFVTNTTTHKQVMEMLEIESAKDFIALIVTQFDVTKHPFVGSPDSLYSSTQSLTSLHHN